LAQAAGTFVLHPIAIGLFAAMLACVWVPFSLTLSHLNGPIPYISLLTSRALLWSS
jgi:hypothetical protein